MLFYSHFSRIVALVLCLLCIGMGVAAAEEFTYEYPEPDRSKYIDAQTEDVFDTYEFVGTYRFNMAGNNNTYTKYATLQEYKGMAFHVQDTSYEAKVPFMEGYVGGMDPLGNKNSSSSELERTTPTSSIKKAWLLIAASSPAEYIQVPEDGSYEITYLRYLEKYGVFLRGPGGQLVHLYPTKIFADYNRNDADGNYASCYIEVSEFVSAWGYGEYTVLNIPYMPLFSRVSSTDPRPSPENGVQSGDQYASWKLVVLEEDQQLPMRMVKLKMGGAYRDTTNSAKVEISGEDSGLKVSSPEQGKPSGELLFAIDGGDMFGADQNFQFTAGVSDQTETINLWEKYKDADKADLFRRSSNRFFTMQITKRGEELKNDPGKSQATNLLNVNQSYIDEINGTDPIGIYGVDFSIMEINSELNNLALQGGETRIEAELTPGTNVAIVVSALGLAVDMDIPMLQSEMTIENQTQDYSSADADYSSAKPTARKGDTLLLTVTTENITPGTTNVGLADVEVVLTLPALSAVDVNSLQGTYPNGTTVITGLTGTPTFNDAGELVLTVSLPAGEVFHRDDSLTFSFKGTAKGEEKGEYTNSVVINGAFVDENGVKRDLELTDLGPAEVDSWSEAMFNEDGILNGKVIWDDADNQDGKRPGSVQVQLRKSVNGGAAEVVGTATVSAPATDEADENEWPFSFSGLLKHEGDEEIIYTVALVGTVNGYTTTVNDYDLTLTHTPLQVPVTVEIQWDVSSSAPRPKVEAKVNGTVFSFPNGTSWSVTQNLPKFQDGQLIPYTADSTLTLSESFSGDTSPQGYELAANYPTATPGTIVEETASIQFTYKLTPKTFAVELDENDGLIEKDGGAIKDTDQNVTYPDGVTEPTQYTYGEEKELPKPIKPGFVFDGWESYDPDHPDDRGTKVGTTIPSGMIDDVNLRPLWIPAEYRVVFHTMGEDSSFTEMSYDYTSSSVALNAPTSQSQYTFAGWYADNMYQFPIATNAPLAFVPAAVEQYVTAESNGADTLINTLNLYARWKMDFEGVSVAWDDENNQDGRRKDVDVVVTGQYGSTQKEAGRKKLAASLDQADFSFINLDAYMGGSKVTYTVSVDLAGAGISSFYTLEADPANPKSFKLRHTPETSLFRVVVEWKDDNNKEQKRPDSLRVKLVADGQFVQPPLNDTEQVLSASNGWSFEWTAQVNVTPRQRAIPLAYDVVLLDQAPEGYSVTATLDAANRVKTFHMTRNYPYVPKTGDDSHPLLWAGMMTATAALLLTLRMKRKERRG